ncbi:MAG: C4-dicarboxylate ABC transporter [Alphaproteobacteria bacterium]|nr:C4-dicarboxylate ABC transporter [Alphaproteobacteria bacterium]
MTALRWLTAAALGLAVSTVAEAQQATMRLSHQVPPAHHMTRMLEGFAADVKARTNGEVEVKLFGSEQLAKAGENFPSVARGAIEAAVSANIQWGKTIPEMAALTIPYFFTDLQKIRKFAASDARKLLDQKLEARGVKSVAWLYITRQSIFTSGKKPLVALDDFKGVKIRGLNALNDHALTAVGAATSAMPGSEVYQALQAGVLDAGLTDVSAGFSRRYYEIQKYGTVAPYFSVYFHLYVNPAWWNKLTAAQRDAIMAAGAKLEQDAIPITEATAEDAIKQLKEKGMTIHLQTPAESAVWKAKMVQPVVDAFLKEAPESGAKLIELLDKL